ncbi:XRE family transcriptional regulator [Streptomyces phaeoluteigriseus]|uniref:XRE family transcriptional regulator n=1 Tax=Streptomyces phaeoluteigriseus TaxID=114686 RepID=A0ABY4Z9F9_9ACTN|nr:XRE family transcriptional regulator [Streptomyces phaeoluteigriseus]USQ85160.1 XRE family transcriptional regulator [Streptomyces phaeoluteigriseus]
MTISGGSDPGEARTASAYVALLRQLKDGSGLTYRQLEQRAAGRGDVLARSTVADVLRREVLPRAELVTALVRACDAEADLPRWLAARERLASAGDETPRDEPENVAAADVPDGDPVRRRRRAPAGRRRVWTASPAALASLCAVALLVVAAMVLLPEDDDAPAGKETGSPSSAESTAAATGPGPAVGYSRIRPVRAPSLCLTEGDVRMTGADRSKTVAVQRPCDQAVPPRTYLERRNDGLYRIQWRHPQLGTGCLTVLTDGAYRDTLEPWDDCRAGGSAQLFRIERAGGSGQWRLRPALDDGLCLGMRGAAAEPGAAAMAERCATGGSRAQVFLIGSEAAG